MKVGIVLDNPRRDLDGVLIVAHHLLRRGHSVYVVPMYQQGIDVPWLGLNAIIVNYARSSNRDFLRSCKRHGIAVVVLDTEGGVVPKENDKTPYGPDAIAANGLNEYIDHYLFWGERQYDQFLHRDVLSREQLHVTGCPRYDFCHPHWQPALSYPSQNYILINTNFSTVNPLLATSAGKEQEQLVKVGWDAEETRAHFEDTTRIFDLYLTELRRLITRNRGRTFLLRPHPFEGHEIYRRRFADCSNVQIDGSGSVMSMLRNATCMVHLNCQTAVETLMMGKLPISLEYVNSDRARHRFPIPSAVSFPASDFSELNEIVQAPGSYLARLSAADLYEQHILPTFFHNDGQAAARVADVVGRVQRHEQLGQSRLTSSLKGGFEHLVVGRLLQGTLSNIFGSKRIAALRAKTNPRRQAKAITCDEVQARLAAIAEADGSIAQVEVANATHPVTRQSMASILLSQHESA